MQEHDVDLYLNGHTHALVQYDVDGKGAYVTSGAGALVLTGSEVDLGRDSSDLISTSLAANKTIPANIDGHTYSSLFYSATSGFTLHTFNQNFTQLTTEFVSALIFLGSSPLGILTFFLVYVKKVDTTGASIHQFVIQKGVTPPPSPPTPPQTCCFYHDTSCASGQICCTGSGQSYSSPATCQEYGAIHNCEWKDQECIVQSSLQRRATDA